MQIDSLNVGTTTIYKIKVYNNSICRISSAGTTTKLRFIRKVM
ncbi:hypothetical protein [Leptospira interrogans]|uniref:Uncharacterized protein n=1 Tax=Leptospira interrogans serovar Hardjo str. Norma TaxID=1279460 RepID=A0A0M4MX07_LEPIR|nr:hypothetical protein [Leptospira interrogans]ALE41108.1 hypothetical protein G436_3968 [Leptospira interrogans serovar Hardjo str. Norma]EKO97894.1 hypothetical protein LEP1GSC057_2626 [Leptospira interrogans str. Brem 329]EMF72526.1 hypothetical protein LEP1GSC148_2472 [Leptospira interrogans serovar Canicola str. LT1962]EKR43549.1 hypothetical protein LEP1GSC097_0159 [Leptospira interrogans serovar Grippotyphosa str. UI 08368]EMM88761.1 hypothetical protein LEP1GSC145_3348 [Leptospira int